ncbi:MAG: hypothetical protein JWM11_3699 [Planctomycetaceae bacterium]|nr:hypothetical protein [Planctomycetaceae bacterium]
MFSKFTFCSSIFAVLASSAILSAQPVDPPHNPPNKDAEPHYKSRPQRQTPRVKIPNTDVLDEGPLPPVAPEDEEAPEGGTKVPNSVLPPGPRVKIEVRGPKTDTVLASFIALANQEEILISEHAGELSQNPNVRKFAMTMAHDHLAFLEKLRRFAPDATKPGFLDAVVLPTRGPASVAEAEFKLNVELPGKVAVAVPDGSRLRKFDLHSSVPQLMSIEREVAAQSLANDKAMLRGKTGLEFDECYLGQQLALHMAMKNKLAVFQRRSSPELAEVLADGQAMTELHWKQAFEMMKTLDAGPRTTQAAPTKRASINSQSQAKD